MSAIDYSIVLTQGDKQSALWRKLQAHLEHLLIRERARNDHLALPDATAFTRGKISLIKELLLLDETQAAEE